MELLFPPADRKQNESSFGFHKSHLTDLPRPASLAARVSQDTPEHLRPSAGAAGEISLDAAWQSLKSFNFNDPDLEAFISRLGTNSPACFKHQFKGGLEIQQVPAEICL
jgi:hypothetical protein